MDLDDVLKEETPAEAPPETPVEAPEEGYTSRKRQLQEKEWAAQGRDPKTGQFIPKEEPKEEPKEVKAEPKEEPKREEFTDKERAFLRAAEEERRKRQELERRLADLEKPKTETEKKTFWDDPEGHLKGWEQALEQKFTQREMNVKLQTAEAIARTKYKDFDANIEVFAGLLQTTPGLREQWLASPDPAEFAYRAGQGNRMLSEAGSIDALREKIEKETRAKLEAEFKAKNEQLEKQRAALPGSLSDVRGASTRQAPVFTGPTPLEDILAGK